MLAHAFPAVRRGLQCGLLLLMVGMVVPGCPSGGGSAAIVKAFLRVLPASIGPDTSIWLDAEESRLEEGTNWKILRYVFRIYEEDGSTIGTAPPLLIHTTFPPTGTWQFSGSALPKGAYVAKLSVLAGPSSASPTLPEDQVSQQGIALVRFWITDCGDFHTVGGPITSLHSHEFEGELTLPEAVHEVPYSYDFPVTGGVPPYTGRGEPGEILLPNGLAFDGVTLKGTPLIAVEETRTGIIRIADSCDPTRNIRIKIHLPLRRPSTPGCDPLLFTPGTPPDALVDAPFSWTFAAATGGQGALSYALADGSTLPPGLVLAGTMISGTPTTAGSYTSSLVATDTCPAGSQSVTVDVTFTVSTVTSTWIQGAGISLTASTTQFVAVLNSERIAIAYLQPYNVLRMALASLPHPSQPTHWFTYDLFGMGGFGGITPSLGVVNNRLVLAASQETITDPENRVFVATKDFPISAGDWFNSPLPETPTAHAGVIEHQGRPAVLCSTIGGAENRLGILLATTAAPLETTDWTVVPLTADDPGPAPDPTAVALNGRVVVGWWRGVEVGGSTLNCDAMISHALSAAPTGPADWRTYPLGGATVSLTKSIETYPVPGNVALAVHNGRLVATFGEQGATAGTRRQVLARANNADPAGTADWTRHVMDPDLGGYGGLGVYNGRLLATYRAADGGFPPPGSPIKVARAGLVEPTGTADWGLHTLASATSGDPIFLIPMPLGFAGVVFGNAAISGMTLDVWTREGNF